MRRWQLSLSEWKTRVFNVRACVGGSADTSDLRGDVFQISGVGQLRLKAVPGQCWAGSPRWSRPGTGWDKGCGTGRSWGWVRSHRHTWCFPRSGGRGLGLEAGHSDLRAALAEDGQLCSPVHPTARQRRMPMLHVHSKVPVHRPAAPFPLDLRLHLEGYTSQGHY